MSFPALRWAFALTLRPPEKAVLLALAWFANPAECAWPSLSTLVQSTGLSRRTVLYALKRLRELGLITLDPKTDFPSLTSYRLRLEDPVQDLHPPVQDLHPPVQDLHPPVQDLHPPVQITSSGGAPLALGGAPLAPNLPSNSSEIYHQESDARARVREPTAPRARRTRAPNPDPSPAPSPLAPPPLRSPFTMVPAPPSPVDSELARRADIDRRRRQAAEIVRQCEAQASRAGTATRQVSNDDSAVIGSPVKQSQVTQGGLIHPCDNPELSSAVANGHDRENEH